MLHCGGGCGSSGCALRPARRPRVDGTLSQLARPLALLKLQLQLCTLQLLLGPHLSDVCRERRERAKMRIERMAEVAAASSLDHRGGLAQRRICAIGGAQGGGGGGAAARRRNRT